MKIIPIIILICSLFFSCFTNLVIADDEAMTAQKSNLFSILYFSQSLPSPAMLEKWKKQNPENVVIAMVDETLIKETEVLDKVDIICLRQGILENMALSTTVFKNHAEKIFNGNIVPKFTDYKTAVKMIELNSETMIYLVNMTYIESIDKLLKRYNLYRANDFSFLFNLLKPNKKNIVIAISDSPLEELNFLLISSSSIFDILINVVDIDGQMEVITTNGKIAFNGLPNKEIGILDLSFAEGEGYSWKWRSETHQRK